MRGADSDENTGFADFEAAEAMNDDDTMDSELCVEQLADFFHLGESHGFVRFVIEVQGAATMGFIADKPIEGNDGAILTGTEVANKCRHIDGGVKQGKTVVFCGGGGHGSGSTPTHRRKKRDCVRIRESSIPGSKLLISGSYEGCAKRSQCWKTGGIALEQIG